MVNDRILSEGYELGRQGKNEVEYLEGDAHLGGIMAVLADPMPKKAWRVYKDHFRRKARKSSDPEMAERWHVCERICKFMWDGATAWDALVTLTELDEMTGDKWCDGITRGMFRDEHHICTQKEWLGRQVG